LIPHRRHREDAARASITFALAVAVLAPLAAADQWPRFRGTQAGLVADDPALPDTWSETENVVWKTDIPGLGWSLPIVWDDHVFITTSISRRRVSISRRDASGWS
jgi:hypothetical protein